MTQLKLNLVNSLLRFIIDIYGINRIIYSTNLLPYSIEYESRKTIPTEYIRKVTRYPVLSQAPWRHFYEYSRRECFIVLPTMILCDNYRFLSSKMYDCVFKVINNVMKSEIQSDSFGYHDLEES